MTPFGLLALLSWHWFVGAIDAASRKPDRDLIGEVQSTEGSTWHGHSYIVGAIQS